MTHSSAQLLAEPQVNLLTIAKQFASHLKASKELRRARHKAMIEFQSCSDRELADMNLSRSDIPGLVANWTPGH